MRKSGRDEKFKKIKFKTFVEKLMKLKKSEESQDKNQEIRRIPRFKQRSKFKNLEQAATSDHLEIESTDSAKIQAHTVEGSNQLPNGGIPCPQ